MESDNKRDLMAAIIISSIMVDKVRWLGEHKRNGADERLEGLLDDSFRDTICGTYILVDEMLKRREVPVPRLEKKLAAAPDPSGKS